jgi:hypothetical protein
MLVETMLLTTTAMHTLNATCNGAGCKVCLTGQVGTVHKLMQVRLWRNTHMLCALYCGSRADSAELDVPHLLLHA